MPKLNRQLVTSVIADINELIAVGNEMCSWVGKVEHLSWRFPTRSARNVNVMGVVQRHKGSAGEMYILLLELAYDRLHFVLRLMVEFMDGYPFIEEIFEKVTSSKRPGSMSLASIVRTLWSKLKLIPETIPRNMIKTKQPDGPVFPISRGCQASGSLYHCESCSSASKVIADLSGILGTALQDNGLSSSIVKERQVIRVDLFHKTQWDVMTRLTAAIAADIYTLLEFNSITRSKSEIDAEEYQKSLNSLRVALDKQNKENKSFEIKIQEMESRLHSVQYELQSLEDSREGLVQKNSTLSACLSKTEEKSSNLEIVLSCVLKQIAEIGESKIALESTLTNLGKELESTRHSNTSETAKLQKILDRLREEKNLETRRHREELEDLELRFGGVLEKFEEKCRQLELAEVKADKKTVAEETPEPLFSKGDPEIDMAQQLTSNQAAIDRLTRQNERLMRTLTRLREYRRSSQTD